MFPFNVLDDDFEFLACIFNYNYTINAEIIRNSDPLNLNNKLKIANNDIDPDKFFYYNDLENLYYLEDNFNKLVNKKSLKSNFSLLHVNARRLHKNIYRLVDYLKDINY